MEEKKHLNENQELRSKRQQKYAGKMIKRVPFSLHVVNDKDIIDRLESVDNVQGYLKNLIRMDMRN